MMRRFLKETPNASARPLSVGRHQVHDSWDQLQAYLRGAPGLGEDYALLFAEPFRSGGATSWMVASDVDPVPFARLPPDQQEALQARLSEMLAALTAFAAQQAASPREEERHWASLLTAIQQQPSEVRLPDRLFSAEGHPVLIQWGCRDDATVATGTLLQERRAVPVAPPPKRAVPPAQAVQMRDGSGRGWLWLPALLWALFLLTMALIFWWLLAACAINLPPSLRLMGECRDRSELGAEQDRNAELRRQLGGAQGALSSAPQCRIADATPDWTRAPTPPLPQPLPQEETDFDRARERAGGAVGDITLTLLWNGKSDLDLIVTCPNGERLAGANSAEGMICGGRIDVDANFCTAREADAGSVCTAYKAEVVDNPVENGFFLEQDAPRGRFGVTVRHFAAAADAPGAPVPFVLQLRQGSDRQTFDGTAQPGAVYDITTFQID